MQILSLCVFLVLQILFLPLALLGIGLVAYRQLVVSKRIGVSQTAIEVLNGRWSMHVFGIRRDEATARLARVLPNTSTLGLWLCYFPLWVKYKISGTYFGLPRIPEEGAESIADLVPARTLYVDRITTRVVGEMGQLVLLGAGFDTRAYRGLESEHLARFEVDQTSTQQLKIANLAKAGIHDADVRFVPVDFSKDRLFEKLEAAGYDPRTKTLFLLEGVTLYLQEEDVRRTLRDIRENTAPGSVVVADFYAERFVEMGKGGMGGRTLAYTGEGFGFGLPFSEDYEQTLQDFLRSVDVEPGETFFLGKNRKQGPYAVVAELKV